MICMLGYSLHLSSASKSLGASQGLDTPSIACVYFSLDDVVDSLEPVVLRLLSTATDCYRALSPHI